MDIEKLKALALTATPGPWDVNQASAMRNGRIVVDELYVYSPETRNVAIASDIADPATGEMSQDNAAYIAAACPATVLELIAEVERLRAEAQRLDFMVAEECQIEHMDRVGAAPLYRVRWPWEEVQMRAWSSSGREAVDAAIEVYYGRRSSCGT